MNKEITILVSEKLLKKQYKYLLNLPSCEANLGLLNMVEYLLDEFFEEVLENED